MEFLTTNNAPTAKAKAAVVIVCLKLDCFSSQMAWPIACDFSSFGLSFHF
jgi:hypothetical protein